MNITNYFKKPGIISIIGDIHTGKSNLIHAILKEISKNNNFQLYTYGFRTPPDTNQTQIYSIQELEQIKNSIIIIDEVMSLLDLDNRTHKKNIENTIRLIHHNNNILLLSLLPENIKKFISAKINTHIFKKSTIADFINGSRTKNIITSYHGNEKGSRILNLPPEEAIIYDDQHYYKLKIPYIQEKDQKTQNQPITTPKNVKENV